MKFRNEILGRLAFAIGGACFVVTAVIFLHWLIMFCFKHGLEWSLCLVGFLALVGIFYVEEGR